MNRYFPTARTWTLVILLVCAMGVSVRAQEFSSSNFTVSNPVLFFPGGYSTSTSFGIQSVISQIAIGTSSATSFRDFAGFLYFPFVSTPVISATAGNAQVALSWTSSDATLGWAVSGYEVGQSTSASGPYTFSSVGNVLSSTRTGLTNATPYYFVIRVIDGLGNAIATSSEVTATPVAPPSTGGSGNSGGSSGGSGSSSNPGQSTINFSGRAYPGSTVTILKDAQVLTTTVADAEANFFVVASGLTAGNYFFSAYGEDNKGNRSSPVTFPVSLTSGVTINIGGIFLAPTIAVDKEQVRKGDDIAIFGQTVKKAEVTIQVNSAQPFFAKVPADANGVYLYNFDTTPLEMGDHTARSKSATSSEISSYGAAVGFIVGTKNVLVQEAKVCRIADFNCDGRVNLVDFSILLYWYRKASPPADKDLNTDGKVDLVDFSIFAYHWTG